MYIFRVLQFLKKQQYHEIVKKAISINMYSFHIFSLILR